jgi:hypothetical protein
MARTAEQRGPLAADLASRLDLCGRSVRRVLEAEGVGWQDEIGGARRYDPASIERFVNSRRRGGSAVYRPGDELLSVPTLSRLWQVAPRTVGRILNRGGLTTFVLSENGPDGLGRRSRSVR